MKSLERLYTRIKFQHKKGGELGYYYNMPSMDSLNLEKESFDDSRLLKVGNKIKLHSNEYSIVEIIIKLEPEYIDFLGANALAIDSDSNYNITLIIILESIE